jgi:hypothetical protein
MQPVLIWLFVVLLLPGCGRHAGNEGSNRPGMVRAYVTGYTWFDNDPPGPAIATPMVHAQAGGTGSYADPVTLAVAEGRFEPGTRFYLPRLRRYLVVEDTCASCGQRDVWIDVWIDGRNAHPAEATACAERMTGTFDVEIDPPAGRPVSAGPVYAANGCTVRPDRQRCRPHLRPSSRPAAAPTVRATRRKKCHICVWRR